jgi:hypothetical protein
MPEEGAATSLKDKLTELPSAIFPGDLFPVSLLGSMPCLARDSGHSLQGLKTFQPRNQVLFTGDWTPRCKDLFDYFLMKNICIHPEIILSAVNYHLSNKHVPRLWV